MYNYKRYNEIQQPFVQTYVFSPNDQLSASLDLGESGLECALGRIARMDVEFTVSLIELNRAFRRLSVRLPDESEVGGELVVFNACHNSLEIVARGTTEGLRAVVIHSGQGAISFSVFRGIARALGFYRETRVRFVFSAEVLRINRTCFRHPSISVLAPLTSVSQDR